MYAKNNNSSKKSISLLLALALLLVVSVAVVFIIFIRDQDSTTPENTGNINYNPPTIEERVAGNQKKQEILNENPSEPVLPEGAEVVIVDSTQYDNEIEVRAFVANIIADGECSITFTNGEESIEKSVPAYSDATTTPCITLTMPRSEFSITGDWEVVVTYTNSEITGSAQGILEVR